MRNLNHSSEATHSRVNGFGYDFLNIVERYLVSDRSKPQGGGAAEQAPRI